MRQGGRCKKDLPNLQPFTQSGTRFVQEVWLRGVRHHRIQSERLKNSLFFIFYKKVFRFPFSVFRFFVYLRPDNSFTLWEYRLTEQLSAQPSRSMY